MIGWLGGTVKLRDPATGTVILDVGGVGYQLGASLQTLGDVPESGGRCELWVHTHAREDALVLYGFSSRAERRMFTMLISVPQIGPRNALTALGGMPLVELATAVSEGRRATLEKIPGIGKKTAERIILDLKDKVAGLLLEVGGAVDDEVAVATAPGDGRGDEARAILVNLGWKPKPVDAALAKVLAESEGEADHAASLGTLDDLVRATLARLMER